jgi:hypothetical protein
MISTVLENIIKFDDVTGGGVQQRSRSWFAYFTVDITNRAARPTPRPHRLG